MSKFVAVPIVQLASIEDLLSPAYAEPSLAEVLVVPELGCEPTEPGRVQFFWDDACLYARFDFLDGSVEQAEGPADRDLYESGDVAELFVRPASGDRYWEFHVAPTSEQAAYFCRTTADRGKGRLTTPPQTAATQITGPPHPGWAAVIAVPWTVLCPKATNPKPIDVCVLAARYNYGRNLDILPELSCTPPVPEINLHRPDLFASLLLQSR